MPSSRAWPQRRLRACQGRRGYHGREIICKTEDGLDLVECFDSETNTCPPIDVCRLSKLFKSACQAFLDVLDEATIPDMAENRGDVLAALNNDWPCRTHAPRPLGAL
jgi:hypothetical protein